MDREDGLGKARPVGAHCASTTRIATGHEPVAVVLYGMLIRARKVLPSPLWKPQPPWLIFAWWLGPPLAVLLTVLWLWKVLAPLMR
jgi:hypothetical protein